jgi:archaellum component FlaF (FlaF/FlaG flagellin family)
MKSPTLALFGTAIGGVAVVALFFWMGRGDFSWSSFTFRRGNGFGGDERPLGKAVEESQESQEKVALSEEELEAQRIEEEASNRAVEKLQGLVGDLAQGKHRKEQTIVHFKTDAEYTAFLKAAADAGFKILGENRNAMSLLLSTPKLNAFRDFLASNPQFDPDLTANPTLEAPTELKPKDPELTANGDVEFSATDLKASVGAGKLAADAGKGVKVAILDSAVANISFFGDKLAVAAPQTENPTSNLDHGTAVASVVLQFAPGAAIYSYPVVAQDGLSDAFTISNAIYQAVNDGVQIINISLGAYQDNPTLQAAVQAAYDKGVVIVASAGNEGLNNSTYPARYDTVIPAIAGSADGHSASFSNNSANHGFISPGVGVPGVYPDGFQYSVNGTSFSAPLDSGLIAATMSSYNVSAQDAVSLLQRTANDAGAAGPDNVYGYGWPNVEDVGHLYDKNYQDLRLAGNHYNTSNPDAPTMDYVVQNNGSTTANGYNLSVTTDGVASTVRVPELLPGQSWGYSVPYNTDGSTANFTSQLIVPTGASDAISTNNSVYSSLTPIAK